MNSMNTVDATRRPLVLLAEDDPELRVLLAFFLASVDMDVVDVESGAELLDALRAEGASYDLVVSDVRMRGLSGVQVLGMTEDLVARPPVLLITAFPDAATERAALALGAAAILAKPFALDEFVLMAQLMAARGALH